MRSNGIKLPVTKSKSNSKQKNYMLIICCTRSLLAASPFSMLKKVSIYIQYMTQLNNIYKPAYF